jgi:hypothetical protein
MRLGLSPWSAAKVEVMVTFWRERKTVIEIAAEIAENIPPGTGNNQAQAVFHRANLFRRSCSILCQHCSSRQQERCRQSRSFARTTSPMQVENALYMSFQAHQVTIA